jgi:NAD(P)-dependent dehydrogenase (short-subunit alcohol dehydrogenase family)
MIADVGGMEPWIGYLPYGATKAGLIYLTRGLAKALAPEVLVNAVAPGTVLPQADAAPEEIAAEEARAALKRLGTPEDIARAVAFLCESDYITGQVLAVDGGKLLRSAAR